MGAVATLPLVLDSTEVPVIDGVLDERARVAAVTERRVQTHLARLGVEDRQNFLHADWPVHARRRLAPLHDLAQFIRMARRVEFLTSYQDAAYAQQAIAALTSPMRVAPML